MYESPVSDWTSNGTLTPKNLRGRSSMEVRETTANTSSTLYRTISDFQSCSGCLPDPPERAELTGLGFFLGEGVGKGGRVRLKAWWYFWGLYTWEKQHSLGLELVAALKAEQKQWIAVSHSHSKPNCNTGSPQPLETFPPLGTLLHSLAQKLRCSLAGYPQEQLPDRGAAEEGHKPGNSTAVLMPTPALELQTQTSVLETPPWYL